MTARHSCEFCGRVHEISADFLEKTFGNVIYCGCFVNVDPLKYGYFLTSEKTLIL